MSMVLGIRHGYDGYIHKGCRCETCTDAQRRYMRKIREEHPELRRRGVEQVLARQRAMRRLASRYPEEMAVLLEDELGRPPLKRGRKSGATP